MEQISEIKASMVRHYLQSLSHLTFEVTDLCNLDCKYCGYSELYKGYDQRIGKMLSFKKARMVLDHLFAVRYHSPEVNYPFGIGFYGGEPLLNISLIRQIIEYAEKTQNSAAYFTYNMTTNAMLLDKYMDYLVEKNFHLLISLDGDEFSQGYRVDHSGKNSFNRVFRNVKLLQENYPEYFQKSVMFNSVLHNRNNVEDIYHFIHDHFGKIPKIAPLNTSGIREDKVQEFRNMYQNVDRSIQSSTNCESLENELFVMAPRVQEVANYIFTQTGNVFNTYNDLFIDRSGNDFFLTGTCLPFSKRMFVTVSGKILPCERIDHDFSLGQVFDDRIELDIEAVTSRHNHYISKCIRQCKSCGRHNHCPQCVYCIDSIRRESVRCPSYCTREDFEKENARTLEYLGKHPHNYEKMLHELSIQM